MLIHWLWLANLPGLSDRQKGELLSRGLDPEDLFGGELEELLPDSTPQLRTVLLDRDLTAAQKILEDCQKENIQILTMGDAAYPNRLKNIADPPAVLYYKGKLPNFDDLPTIAVVGTRKASAYGLNTARRLGYQIAACGGLVVSGMALGIDAMAMRGALEADEPVIGVLGCGVDQVYPRANRALFEETARRGCILSEFAPGTSPQKWTFPKRNRIMAGLSCGVLVVEAPQKSGSLITARQALEQGRDVFVVPGNVDLEGFQGSYQLLRDGAIPVGDGWEVVEEYADRFPGKVHKALSQPEHPVPEEALSTPKTTMPKVAQKPRIPREKTAHQGEADKKAIDKGAGTPYIDLNATLPKLSSEEAAVVAALRDGERLVDDVIAETGLSTGRMLGILTMLELKGILKRLPGKRIAIK